MAVILSATSATSGDAAWAASGAATAFGNTLTVAESGGQYTAIETALAAAVAGDIVLVYPGTYVVPVAGYTVPASVSLVGTDRQTVVLDAVANVPAAAVTLNANSLIERVRITLADTAAIPVGVAMTGIQGTCQDVEFGAATAVLGQIGINVTGTDGCMVFNPIVRGPALATLITVGGASPAVVRVYSIFCQTTITCNAARSFIENTGGILFIVGGSLAITGALRAFSAGGIFNEAHDLTMDIGTTPHGFFGVAGGAGGILYTFGCRCDSADTADFSGEAANVLYRSQGDYFGVVSVPQANASSRLPDARGTAVVPNGLALVTIAAATIGGAAYDGHTVFATLREADGVITVANCTWSGGGALTIRTTAVVTADRDVSWFIPG